MILFFAILGTILGIIALYDSKNHFNGIKDLNKKYNELYKDFHYLNFFTRGMLDTRNMREVEWRMCNNGTKGEVHKLVYKDNGEPVGIIKE